MTYTIHFSPNADHQIRRLSRRDLIRLKSIIDGLKAEPRPKGAVLVRTPGAFRQVDLGPIYSLRVGPYVIDYELSDEDRVVVIATIEISARKSGFIRRIWSWR